MVLTRTGLSILQMDEIIKALISVYSTRARSCFFSLVLGMSGRWEDGFEQIQCLFDFDCKIGMFLQYNNLQHFKQFGLVHSLLRK